MNSNPTNKNSRESYSKKDVENRITNPTTLSVDDINVKTEDLTSLIGKTIKSITRPDSLQFSDYDIEYCDDNIQIEFTDKTVLKLASWEYDGYASGIFKSISVRK